MAASRGLLDARDPDGCTPFLHWCGSGPTPNVLQLLIAHGCDVDATDNHGNTGLHRLVQSRNLRALEALAKDQPVLLCRAWLARYRAGLNVLELSAVVMLARDRPPQLGRLGPRQSAPASCCSARIRIRTWHDWQQY